MLELTIDKLPGGDAARRLTLIRVTLTNTGEGFGEVKVYGVRVVKRDEKTGAALVQEQCRTHRSVDECVLRLVHRAIGTLLGESD